MTEAEWQSSRDPTALLAHLKDRGGLSERKGRLFAVACCARVAHLIPDVLGRRALVVAERYADGDASERELHVIADTFCPCGVYNADYGHPALRAAHFALYPETAERAATWAFYARRRRDKDGERAAQAALVRCIFGNPFRPSPVIEVPALVRKLAHAIYEERAFERLPVLADALEEAGCTDAALLAHCRQPGEHARGCWVIDLLRQ